MIKVIVDSTCDLPEAIMKQYGIQMVPLRVNIKGKEYLDKVTISVEEVYDYLRQNEYGKTSQPNIMDVHDAIKGQIELGHDVIFITISSKLSGTHQTVNLVVEELKEAYPDHRVQLIDSLGGSGVPALIALQAVKLIEQNHSFDEIVDTLQFLANHCEHIFTIDNLKYIIKSGRINKTEAIIGNLLKIKPILHVNKGEIEFYQKVRGMKKALHQIVDIVEERIKDFPKQVIGIMHADDLETAKSLEQMIKERISDVKVIMDKIGSTLGTHLGIGGVGVFFFNTKPELYIY